MGHVTQQQASKLLHNKFVVILGDSIQRSVYKDLVLLLQRDSYLNSSQLKNKGELSFEKDCLVEGGRLGMMNNGTAYKEVRQYRTDHHLVRFYFVTRVFSTYMESILADFDKDLKPDLVIINSCLWDLSRYSREWASEYRQNLDKFFRQVKTIMPEESLVVWNMTMPLGEKVVGGFLVPEVQHVGSFLRWDVIEANLYGATLANKYGFDVLDMHFHFRFSFHLRTNDGVHWNAVAHRKMTCLLLEHAAQAWGIQLSSPGGDNSTSAPCWPVQYKSSGTQFHSFGMNVVHRGGENSTAFPSWPVQYNGSGTQFHSYHNFGMNALHRGGENSTAFPSWPVNNFVMKHKHRRPYNPYTREKPHHLYKY